MTMEEKIRECTPSLLCWYANERRHLPWREEISPYRTWVSEIMLQQTRVTAVLPYFERFMAALPDLESLAAVDDEKLMKLWQGLGYYSRARHLKQAAKEITDHRGGIFPSSYKELLTLPGVGIYTAGAIASIAFHEAVPAVDGNVLRILARLCLCRDNILADETKKRFRTALLRSMPQDVPGDFNQALMDLGAMICLPKHPDCKNCPMLSFCEAAKHNDTENIPVRRKKSTRKTEEKTVFVLIKDKEVAMHKRDDAGLLAGLWEFPNVQGFLEENAAADWLLEHGLTVRKWYKKLSARHLFTHIEWQMQGYAVEVSEENTPWGFYGRKAFCDLAIPEAFRKFVLAAEEYL